MSNAKPKVFDAKDILKSENKMLDLVVAMIDFAEGYTDDNFEFHWGEELSAYRDINDKCIKMKNDDLRRALEEEIAILQKCSDSITSKSAAAQYWKSSLLRNKYYTEQTLKWVGATA
jgi:hypothetical protein